MCPAWADSRITSPSWPVRVRLPLPLIRLTSMLRTSPRQLLSKLNPWPLLLRLSFEPPRSGNEEDLGKHLSCARLYVSSLFALNDFSRSFAAQAGNGTLQITYPSFACVFANNSFDSVVRKGQLLWLKPMFFQLLWQQKLAADMEFFLLGIAGRLISSIRSSNARGIVWVVLAVVINIV